MKFLVVDDSPTMRRIVNNALNRLGYREIIEAEDGRDAMAKLIVEDIDFIITDWNMPVMNGLQLTKAVRQNAEHSEKTDTDDHNPQQQGRCTGGAACPRQQLYHQALYP